MKNLKLMLETSYSIDAIFHLRKSSIIASLLFLIMLSIMQMTPTAFALIGDAPYRWDLNIWKVSESSKQVLENSLPTDCMINNQLLSCKQSHVIELPEGVKVAFNSSRNKVNNGLIFNEDYFLFIENGNEYKLGYVEFEDLNFAETTYDDIFNRVASTIKPIFMPALLMTTYQSGILLTFVFIGVVSILFMLLKMGHQTFLTYKEVLNLVIYSSTFPAVMSLVIGMFNGALSMIIYNIGTLVVLFFVYRQKIEPYLSEELAG